MLADRSPPRIEYTKSEKEFHEEQKADSNNNAASADSTTTMERKSLIDVATLLELKGVVAEDDGDEDDFDEEEAEDSEERLENSSSLESLDADDDFLMQGDEIRASSTSCSENSFEMSSTNSFVSTLNRNGDSGFEGGGTDADISERRRPSIEEERQSNTTTTDDEPMPSTSTMSSDVVGDCANPIAFLFEDRPIPSSSQSMNSFLGAMTHRNPEKFQKMRESIDKEVNSLDTRLPSFDFDKLEKQLASAAFERQMTERKFLGEQVRRRLAMQYEQYADSSPAVHTRPLKSNLGQRLQTAMNLQVCYMNDLEDEESSDEDDDDDRCVVEDESDEDDLFGGVPKSKSAPNLKARLDDRSIELTEKLGANALAKASTSKERLEVLERETRVMLEKAKEAARMQMELERRPFVLAEADAARKPKKLCRMQLSRMPVMQLREMVDDLNRRIDVKNSELVKLLIERDGLHMEQDSTLVDIEDHVQHSSNLDSLNLPSFLVAEQNLPKQTTSTPPKLRILKR